MRGKRPGRTDKRRYLPKTSSGVQLFFLAPPVHQVPRLPSMCCSESEDSIELNSKNLFQPQPVFFSFFHSHFSSRSDVVHTVTNCVQVQILPSAQATPALTDFFSRCRDPHTHACKARPQTTVGWTSLNVIVIVIDVKKDSAHIQADK